MPAPVRLSPPSAPLLTVAATKVALRVDLSDDDGLIEILIAAAEGLLDGYAGELGRALVTQRWRQDLPAFPPDGVIRLPLAPVIAVTEVAYRGADGVTRTLPPSAYGGVLDAAADPYLRRTHGWSWPATWPCDDAVSVTFDAGYGAPDSVPAPIRAAARLIVGHLYENREAVAVGVSAADLPFGVERLTAGFRRVRV